MGIKRLTLKEFQTTYPNEDACLDKIFQLRFSNLICPKCENDNKFKRVEGRRSYYCPSCGFQIYPTKDTVFEKTTTPLTDWFLIIFMQCITRNCGCRAMSNYSKVVNSKAYQSCQKMNKKLKVDRHCH